MECTGEPASSHCRGRLPSPSARWRSAPPRRMRASAISSSSRNPTARGSTGNSLKDCRVTAMSRAGTCKCSADRRERSRSGCAPLAVELAAAKVDVILAASIEAARSAKLAAPGVPTVFLISGDPVLEGLVTSLSRPQGYLTGLITRGEELTVQAATAPQRGISRNPHGRDCRIQSRCLASQIRRGRANGSSSRSCSFRSTT